MSGSLPSEFWKTEPPLYPGNGEPFSCTRSRVFHAFSEPGPDGMSLARSLPASSAATSAASSPAISSPSLAPPVRPAATSPPILAAASRHCPQVGWLAQLTRLVTPVAFPTTEAALRRPWATQPRPQNPQPLALALRLVAALRTTLRTLGGGRFWA